MPSDDTFVLWTPCPECDGVGEVIVSDEDDPDVKVETCWRCKGDGGWLSEDKEEEDEEEGHGW